MGMPSSFFLYGEKGIEKTTLAKLIQSVAKSNDNMSHSHNHQKSNYNRAFAIGIILNVVFVAIEAGYGVAAGSLALIADAGHNLSDVLSLLLAWGAGLLATKPATSRSHRVTRARTTGTQPRRSTPTWRPVGRSIPTSPTRGSGS